MTFCKIIRYTLKSRSANFTRLNHTPFVYSESRDGINPATTNNASKLSKKNSPSPLSSLKPSPSYSTNPASAPAKHSQIASTPSTPKTAPRTGRSPNPKNNPSSPNTTPMTQ
ncbi:hypothetical protein [Rubritalea tangerina]|uniref:hypothetical protein n=1 Tax=Rubritalea tangerina TaxID=430798 RepID=UPI003605D235